MSGLTKLNTGVAVRARAGDLNLTSRAISRIRDANQDWEDAVLVGMVVSSNNKDARIYWPQIGSTTCASLELLELEPDPDSDEAAAQIPSSVPDPEQSDDEVVDDASDEEVEEEAVQEETPVLITDPLLLNGVQWTLEEPYMDQCPHSEGDFRAECEFRGSSRARSKISRTPR
jgi:hypothetical protein